MVCSSPLLPGTLFFTVVPRFDNLEAALSVFFYCRLLSRPDTLSELRRRRCSSGSCPSTPERSVHLRHRSCRLAC